MINLKNNFINALDTKKGFGNIVDIFFNIMVFQVIYCIMLTIDFNRYQNNDNNFQPIKYLSSAILLILIIISEKYILELWKLALFEIVVSAALILLVPIDGNKLVFSAGCIFLCARSILKHRFRYSFSASYGDRFRSKNRIWIWIVIMIAAFIYHFFSSDNSGTVISSTVCTYYMLTSFAVFVISIIMTKYSFRFYEYFRQEKKEDITTEKQIKYSFAIIFITAIIAMGVIFIIFGDLFVPVVRLLSNLIQKIIFSLMLSIFKIDLSSDRKINHQFEVAESDFSAIRNQNVRADSPIGSVVPAILILVVIGAVLFIIWKIYKSILANYKIENDEAEFISIKEDTNYEEIKESIIRTKYGRTNKEKVRKYYFQEISKRNRKNRKQNLTKKTPSEINLLFYQDRNDNEKLKKMTDIYEKARYSADDISETELNDMKDLYDKT